MEDRSLNDLMAWCRENSLNDGWKSSLHIKAMLPSKPTPHVSSSFWNACSLLRQWVSKTHESVSIRDVWHYCNAVFIYFDGKELEVYRTGKSDPSSFIYGNIVTGGALCDVLHDVWNQHVLQDMCSRHVKE